MPSQQLRFSSEYGLDASGFTLPNVAAPVNSNDAVNKAFATNASNLSSGTIASSILGNSSFYIGTTQIALNRASQAINLTGITSIDGNAATASKLFSARTISLTGDVTGSVSFDGTLNVNLASTLANSGVTPGTYNNVTVNAKGIVTGSNNVAYLTANQNIAISGDATGSGTTAITLTLANTGVTANTYGSATQIPIIAVDSKGRITTASMSSTITATNISGGVAGGVVWQTAASTTSVTAAGTSGQVFTSNGTNAPGWVNQSSLSVGSATNASNVTLSDTTTNATYYPTFAAATNQNSGLSTTSSKLTFNPSTGTLSATKFVGDGTGLTGITSTTTAIQVTTDNATNAWEYPVWSTNTTTGVVALNNTPNVGLNPSNGNMFVNGTMQANTGMGTPFLQLKKSATISTSSTTTIQIASGSGLNGTYYINAIGDNVNQYVILNVVSRQYSAAVVSIVSNFSYNSIVALNNFRVVGNADGSMRYLVCDTALSQVLTINAGGVGGVDSNLDLSITPGGSTAVTNSQTTLIDQDGNMLINTQANPYHAKIIAVTNAQPGLIITGNPTAGSLADISITRAGATESGTIGSGACLQLINGTNKSSVMLQQYSNNFQIFNNTGNIWTEVFRITSSGNVLPGATNTQAIGSSSNVWTTIYVQSAPVVSSDANYKTDIVDLDAAELAVATTIRKKFKRYRLLDTSDPSGVSPKYHVGIIAQDLQQAFADNGLNADDYAMFHTDTWYELDGVVVDSGTEGAVAVTRLAVRYEELLSFMMASL